MGGRWTAGEPRGQRGDGAFWVPGVALQRDPQQGRARQRLLRAQAEAQRGEAGGDRALWPHPGGVAGAPGSRGREAGLEGARSRAETAWSVR